jgi:dTDP-4-amino-4,6-dideoxygalactose transaminase
MPKLALFGGPKVRSAPFPSWPVHDHRDLAALESVLKSGVWGIGGTKVDAIEAAFAAYQDARHAVAVFNGTVALEVALRAAGIGAGHEVVMPAYTFMATPAAALAVNALPVFADIDPATYTMDPVDAERRITTATKALMPVHIGGCPSDMDAFRDIAKRHGLVLIEDACQAWGAAWRGTKVGAIGSLGAFSFQSSKNLNSGEGGMLVTNDDGLYELAWSYHNCGRVKSGKWYQHEVLGLNYRMTEFQAALLLVQLERLPEQARRRAENASALDTKLASVDGITPPGRRPEVTAHANHIYVLRYDASRFGGVPRARFLEALSAEGIPCSPGYVPLYAEGFMRNLTKDAHLRDLYGDRVDYARVSLPATERACREEGIWLSQTMLLGDHRDTDDIAAAIRKVRENASELRAAR